MEIHKTHRLEKRYTPDGTQALAIDLKKSGPMTALKRIRDPEDVVFLASRQPGQDSDFQLMRDLKSFATANNGTQSIGFWSDSNGNNKFDQEEVRTAESFIGRSVGPEQNRGMVANLSLHQYAFEDAYGKLDLMVTEHQIFPNSVSH